MLEFSTALNSTNCPENYIDSKFKFQLRKINIHCYRLLLQNSWRSRNERVNANRSRRRFHFVVWNALMKNVNEKRKRTSESVVIVLYLRMINIYNEVNNFQK